MDISITALGTAIPPHKGLQTHVLEFMSTLLNLDSATQKRLKALYRTTGIHTRYSVLDDYSRPIGRLNFFPNDAQAAFPTTGDRMKAYQAQALPLALAAIADCFTSIPHFDKRTLTHLITISCTGMYAPGLDIDLVHTLKLSPQIKRTAIQFMGCYAAVNGLKLAKDICAANPAAKVLVVSVELCTLHLQKSTAQDHLLSGAIFSDGAAAALVETKSNASRQLRLHHFYCDILPNSSNDMAWHIGDSGFEMLLTTYVPQAIKSGIAAFLKRLQAACNCYDIAFYAIHPGGKSILQACEQALNLCPNHNRYSYQILRDYGNMSSATLLFVLKAIWDELTAHDNKKNIFSCAFGPGLTLESMLLEAHVAQE